MTALPLVAGRAEGALQRPDLRWSEMGWGFLDVATCAVEPPDPVSAARALLAAARQGLAERGVFCLHLPQLRRPGRLDTCAMPEMLRVEEGGAFEAVRDRTAGHAHHKAGEPRSRAAALEDR